MTQVSHGWAFWTAEIAQQREPTMWGYQNVPLLYLLPEILSLKGVTIPSAAPVDPDSAEHLATPK